MKKLLVTIATILIFNSILLAQLTIEDCQERARENYPLIKRYALIEKTKEYNMSNAGKGYLPQFLLGAKASYQSQVTEVPIDVPGVEGQSKDQYSATVDVTQVVWDGGVISAQKKNIKASSDIEQKQLDVEMYAIRERVNNLYFGILLLDAQLKQNQLLYSELVRNYKTISSYVDNGVANQADLDAIRVEQLKVKQDEAQLVANKVAYIQMLQAMIGEVIDGNVTLQQPDDSSFLLPNSMNRIELQLFEAQKQQLEVQKEMLKVNYMPKLGLFMTGGYGRPGLNMLAPDFSAYYIGGVRLTWNLGNLYTKKNDRRKIDISQQSLAVQRETFLFNTDLSVKQESNEIKKNKDLIKYDDEIIGLRKSVKIATQVKVENGISSVADLLRDINLEDLARQDKILHEIQLLMSIYSLKNTTNN